MRVELSGKKIFWKIIQQNFNKLKVTLNRKWVVMPSDIPKHKIKRSKIIFCLAGKAAEAHRDRVDH